MPDDRESGKKKLSEVKERILAIARAENTRKQQQEKRKARCNFEKKPVQIHQEIVRGGEKCGPQYRIWKRTFGKKYADPLAVIPLGHLSEPNHPHSPEEKFDNLPLKLGEIKDFVRKERARSSPRINGISYKLYKKCPKILALLWNLLREAHRKKFIAESWEWADRIHILKGKYSSKLDQFWSISFLNVEGKIFFGVIAKRITRFVISYGYVNISTQKPGFPGFPVCIERTTMLWDRIKTAKNNESAELHVIWLDLESVYGSVRHQLLEKAMEFFWIPEDIKTFISTYFKCTYMRFSNYEYWTNWQKLNIGHMMGRVISPLLFPLAMEMILRSTDINTNEITGPLWRLLWMM